MGAQSYEFSRMRGQFLLELESIDLSGGKRNFVINRRTRIKTTIMFVHISYTTYPVLHKRRPKA